MIEDHLRKIGIALISFAAVLCLLILALTPPNPACAVGPCPGFQCTSSAQCTTCASANREGEKFGWCR